MLKILMDDGAVERSKISRDWNVTWSRTVGKNIQMQLLFVSLLSPNWLKVTPRISIQGSFRKKKAGSDCLQLSSHCVCQIIDRMSSCCLCWCSSYTCRKLREGAKKRKTSFSHSRCWKFSHKQHLFQWLQSVWRRHVEGESRMLIQTSQLLLGNGTRMQLLGIERCTNCPDRFFFKLWELWLVKSCSSVSSGFSSFIIISKQLYVSLSWQH